MNIFRLVDDFVFGGSKLRMVISISAIIPLVCAVVCLSFGVGKEHYSSIEVLAACGAMFVVFVIAFTTFGVAMQDSSDSSPTNSNR